MYVVVVESPAKARSIGKYLGPDYRVMPSFGHVRDLDTKEGAVQPDQDFAMQWSESTEGKKHVGAIARALGNSKGLYLATDPDREGEAIAWHVMDILRKRNKLKHISEVARVSFNEVTKHAVREAFARPRAIDSSLVDAYLARRALDYLVGYSLSPILWRKLPGSKSAGRVQSVGLRLACERESEIEAFQQEEYWNLHVALHPPKGDDFCAKLTHLDGHALKKFSLPNQKEAQEAHRRIEQVKTFAVRSLLKRPRERNPKPPFITATLQQAASTRLGFSPSRTMRLAQTLYEGVELQGNERAGLITYMRTDGTQIADSALSEIREVIARDFGDRTLPKRSRVYRTKARNAQEAHEAIRPTSARRRPREVASLVDKDAYKLYTLIWQRTLASQMTNAVFSEVHAEFSSPCGQIGLGATGRTLSDAGFLSLYRDEGEENTKDLQDSQERTLPPLDEGMTLERREVEAKQSFTRPPPRYSEAGLVQKLEHLGIGRPSTYASTMRVLQDRAYLEKQKRQLLPTERGRLVSAFLSGVFSRYVANDFTSRLEQELDKISEGAHDWKAFLRDFWKEFNPLVVKNRDLSLEEVSRVLENGLGWKIFGDAASRNCPDCGKLLFIRSSPRGGFVGCSGYPDCTYTRSLLSPSADRPAENGAQGSPGADRRLGIDPKTSKPVFLRVGRFGPYIQLGEKKADEKPKNASLTPGMIPSQVTLETALQLLKLPRELGMHRGSAIVVGIGRYGPYVRHQGKYRSLGEDSDPFTMNLEQAVAAFSQHPRRKGETEIGLHPEDEVPVFQGVGRYGPYVRMDKTYASIAEGVEPSLEEALRLLEKKKQSGRRKKRT